MPSIDLYWSPGSCARVPFIALEETGAPFTVHVLNRYIGDHLTPEYQALNPKGKVPTVVLDGWVITENPVIQTVVARTFTQARLLPTGEERTVTEALSMMAWFASAIHPAAGRQRFPGAFCDDESGLKGVRSAARRELEKSFAILERRLSEREWLFDEWTIVDAYMLWLWFRAIGSGMDGAAFPSCADAARRTEVRPSVARVLDREEVEFARFEKEGTVPEGMPPYQVGRIPQAPVAVR
jgi:glutathione S-transferase